MCFCRSFSDRFAGALKRVVFGKNENDAGTLEKWHESVEGFQIGKSCRAAKRELGRLRKAMEASENSADGAEWADLQAADRSGQAESLQAVYHDFLQRVIFPHLVEELEAARPSILSIFQQQECAGTSIEIEQFSRNNKKSVFGNGRSCVYESWTGGGCAVEGDGV